MTTFSAPPFRLSDQDRLDAMRLARTPGVGPINFSRLLCQYGGPTAAVEALPDRMRQAGRLDLPSIPSAAQMASEIEALHRMGGDVLIRGDAAYPLMLSFIKDAPPVLFVQGDPTKLSLRSVGIVGARNASAAGIRMAESLSAELADSGICVISGLARGIDSAAHEAALYPSLTTAAVAGGLDHVYPPENAKLQASIAERGCVVTEAPLGTIPQARHFPRRNRLIAGISLGCVVVEAAMHSGTLITASLALSYDREVYAVPGSPLDPRSRGGNDLLRHGATLTENVQDILSCLPSELPDPLLPPWMKNQQNTALFQGFSEPCMPWGMEASEPWEDPDLVLEKVLPLLSVIPVTVDEVMRRCQFSVSAVLSVLTELELGGVVEFVPGGRVALQPNRK
ncbi:DNA processing chain A [Gluconobacter thailandicus F149-1 = NBRC 100600]|nr:DNA-processing protein DprA [Gluconobacter thailandicus]KXV52651.1 DNA processing protein DprA [Gluconobacter thailandicus]GAN92744.1 DNA processing chain A [Gluconobacter thailandicus F149-1 = NBRC 100600]GBR57396.1 DNA processing protein DprA [Gluconobacter thailandicus F149-1 = NBRC 100600]GEL86649.1 DNA processing protein DprA [Gluconobacter thailandicus F149-1 = NBRC 100600]